MLRFSKQCTVREGENKKKESNGPCERWKQRTIFNDLIYIQWFRLIIFICVFVLLNKIYINRNTHKKTRTVKENHQRFDYFRRRIWSIHSHILCTKICFFQLLQSVFLRSLAWLKLEAVSVSERKKYNELLIDDDDNDNELKWKSSLWHSAPFASDIEENKIKTKICFSKSKRYFFHRPLQTVNKYAFWFDH